MEAQVQGPEGPQEAGFWPEGPPLQGVFGRRRGMWPGLLLTALTLGVYHFYFHAVSHAELVQQLGRRNREAPLVFAYGGLLVFGLFFGGSLLYVPFLAAAGVFVFMVARQHAVLEDARRHLGLPPGPGLGGFFLRLVPGALVVVGPLFAYRDLVEDYNTVWREFRRGDRTDRDRLSARRASRPPVPTPSPDPAPGADGSTNGSKPPVVAAVPGVNGTVALEAPRISGRSRSSFSVRDRGSREKGLRRSCRGQGVGSN